MWFDFREKLESMYDEYLLNNKLVVKNVKFLFDFFYYGYIVINVIFIIGGNKILFKVVCYFIFIKGKKVVLFRFR